MILDCKISSGFFYALPDQKSSTYEMIHKTDIFTILFYFILGSGPEIKYSFNIVEIDVGDGRVQGNKTKKKTKHLLLLCIPYVYTNKWASILTGCLLKFSASLIKTLMLIGTGFLTGTVTL